MKLNKWKKEILFFILSLTGAGSSSLIATNSQSREGFIKFVKSLEGNDLTNKFIYTVGGNSSDNNEIKPTELIKNLSSYSSSIPLLLEGFAIQTAKQILNKSLLKGTNYISKIHEKSYEELAQNGEKVKKEIDEARKNRPKSLKKDRIRDEKRYLTALKDYLLTKINEYHIKGIKWHLKKINSEDKDEDPFQAEESSSSSSSSSSSPTNGKNGREKLPSLLAFFLARWKQEFKAGFYVHDIIPYAGEFDNSTKEMYSKKYNNLTLPSSPNYFFPDYSRKWGQENKFEELLKEWKNGRSYYSSVFSVKASNQDEKFLQKAQIMWINKNNDSHKNIAIKLLADEKNPEEKQQNEAIQNFFISKYQAIKHHVSRWINWSSRNKCHYIRETSESNGSSENMIKTFKKLWFNETITPMNLFCINQENNEHPEFLLFQPDKKDFEENKSISKKILFYRDKKGFNVIYPINQKIIDSDKENKNLQKSNLINEFKKFIEENFFHLLLKYRLRALNPKNNNGKTKERCCCDEIIKNLLILLKIGRKLSDWNEIWKTYDIRRLNNDFLKTGINFNYFDKLGTISANPPEFFSERIKKDISKLSDLQKPIKTYTKQISSYFEGISAQQSKGNNLSKNHYWSFSTPQNSVVKTNQEPSNSQENQRCMKKEVADFLLEKIYKEKLIKKFLSIPISFKSALEWASGKENVSTQVNQVSSTNTSQDIKNLFNENFQTYFKNMLNGQEASKDNSQGGKTPKLIKEVLNIVNQELILSEMSEISDTTIFNLLRAEQQTNSRTRRNAGQSQQQTPNNKNPLENIENYLTLINLNNPQYDKDRLNEKLRILITTIYLMENSFERYREWIRNIIHQEGFGVYAFTLSWNKYCDIKNKLNPMNKVDIDSFWTPIENDKNKEWDNQKFDPRQCIETMDRYSSTSVKKRLSTGSLGSIGVDLFFNLWNQIADHKKDLSKENLMGFKGIISKEMLNKIPKDIYSKISDFIHSEGYVDWDEVRSQIERLKTNRGFKDYIDKLEKIDPKIGEAFKLTDYRKLKEEVESAKEVEPLDFVNLKKKKELLNKFIDEYIFGKENISRWGDGKMIEVSISPKAKNQKRFQGLLKNSDSKDVESYTFSSEELEDWITSSSYLIQITTNDLKDDSSFHEFAKKYLTPQMLLQDIVKQARIKSLQSKAINHFLSRGKWANGQLVSTLRSSDFYLKDQFTTIIL